jgi:hypothetical protein
MIAKGTVVEVAVAISELACGHPKRIFCLGYDSTECLCYLVWGGRDGAIAMEQVDAFVWFFWSGTYGTLMSCHAPSVLEAIELRMTHART